MVENQHEKITGDRDLTNEEIGVVNHIKAEEDEAATTLKSVRDLEGVDQRWVAIARTHLEEGFSALVRAVTKPSSPFDNH